VDHRVDLRIDDLRDAILEGAVEVDLPEVQAGSLIDLAVGGEA
jgi:hypothetical protein